ncbi:MAG: AAA family ATPase [bacterium]|nr:AAA family ATPase [bacterium]
MVDIIPNSKGENFNWDMYTELFQWIRDMKEIPQNPKYHAEGNVWIHTRMVLEQLIVMEAWQALPSEERAIVFLAALIHDVGKIPTTKEGEDGQIESPRHTVVGERMAREILWKGIPEPVPFPIREKIVKLVRYHGFPLWFIEKKNPERGVITTSQFVSMRHLTILAEADIRGRIGSKLDRKLDSVKMLKEYCAELGCLDSAYSFPDPLSRFTYFRKTDSSPAYVPYDDTAFTVIMMSGLPGSGKDTWIKKNNRANSPVVSLDDIRQELNISPQKTQGKVVEAGRKQAREYMRKKESFIWNATNTTALLREQVIGFFLGYNARVKIVYVETGYENLWKQNHERDDPVPETIINKMINKLDIPSVVEAHEVEYVY